MRGPWTIHARPGKGKGSRRKKTTLPGRTMRREIGACEATESSPAHAVNHPHPRMPLSKTGAGSVPQMPSGRIVVNAARWLPLTGLSFICQFFALFCMSRSNASSSGRLGANSVMYP